MLLASPEWPLQPLVHGQPQACWPISREDSHGWRGWRVSTASGVAWGVVVGSAPAWMASGHPRGSYVGGQVPRRSGSGRSGGSRLRGWRKGHHPRALVFAVRRLRFGRRWTPGFRRLECEREREKELGHFQRAESGEWGAVLGVDTGQCLGLMGFLKLLKVTYLSRRERRSKSRRSGWVWTAARVGGTE